MVKKTIIFLFIFISNFSFSQDVIDYKKLDNLLINNNYEEFYNSVKKIKNTKEKLNYLTSKQYDGHPIIYWEIANIYREQLMNGKFLSDDKKLINLTRNYFYIGFILLKQDSESCHSQYAKDYFTSDYFKKYQYMIDFENRYKNNNADIFNSSVKFVNSLKNRPNYYWPCFSINKNVVGYGKYTDIKSNEISKQIVINQLRDKISK